MLLNHSPEQDACAGVFDQGKNAPHCFGVPCYYNLVLFLFLFLLLFVRNKERTWSWGGRDVGRILEYLKRDEEYDQNENFKNYLKR